MVILLQENQEEGYQEVEAKEKRRGEIRERTSRGKEGKLKARKALYPNQTQNTRKETPCIVFFIKLTENHQGQHTRADSSHQSQRLLHFTLHMVPTGSKSSLKLK